MKLYKIYFATKQKNSPKLAINIAGKSIDDVLEKFTNAMEGEYKICSIDYLFDC